MPSPSTSTEEGVIVRFDCRVSGRPEPTVTWYKDNVEIITCEHYKPVVNEEGNYALLIMGAIPQRDSGVYTCVARNFCGEDRFTVQLTVHRSPTIISPKFVERFTNTSVVEGDQVVLYCRSIGTMPLELSWQKDGIQLVNDAALNGNLEIKNKDGASQLTIHSAKGRDQGWYQCTAQNQSGSVAVRGKLSVELLPSAQPAGEPLKLNISKVKRPLPVQAADPEPETVQLRHVYKVYEQQHQEQRSTVTSEMVIGRDGEVVGREQAQQQQPQQPPFFTTHLRDVALVEGDRALFEAYISCTDYSELSVEWYLNGRVLNESSDSRVVTTNRYGYLALAIMSVGERDSGLIECRVRNGAGQSKSSCELKVAGGGTNRGGTATASGASGYTHRYECREDSEFYRHQREVDEQRLSNARAPQPQPQPQPPPVVPRGPGKSMPFSIKV